MKPESRGERPSRALRILVVDDDEVDRAAIRRSLSRPRHPHEIMEAGTAEGALELARSAVLDCIILDHFLPDGDSSVILAELKREGIDVPVIVLTGNGSEELAVELLQAGAAHYLTKSTSWERLESSVRSVVRWFRSEQKARVAEDALRASRESLATTLQSVADGVITTDSFGHITYLNPAAARYCILPAEACLNKPLWEVLRTEDRRALPAQRERLDSALTRGLAGSMTELHVLTADGELVVLQERVNLLLTADRQAPAGLVLTLTDITDRLRNQERLEFLLSVGNELACGFDLQGTLDTAAHAALRRLGRGCILGVAPRGDAWNYAVAPDSKRLLELAKGLFRTGAEDDVGVARLVQRGELLVVPPDNNLELVPQLGASGVGYTAWLPLQSRHSIGLLVLEASEPWRRDELSLARDFVQRVGLALDNALLVRRLEESVRIRDETLAVVSHDLRSPLNALTLATDNLVEECNLPEAEGYGEVVQRSIARMNRLIQDLLDSETMASGEFSVYLEACPLDGVIHELTRIHEPLCEARGLSFQVERVGELPAVWADRHRLVQVLSNLLGNAIKFTHEGFVRLRVEGREQHVHFSVLDSGPGIPAECREQVFERFWRVDRKAAGSGLGLAIVKGILRAHGASAQIAAGPNGGTEFSFDLPAAPAG